MKIWCEICDVTVTLHNKLSMKRTLETLIIKILGQRYLPIWAILFIDLALVAFAFVFSILLLTNFNFQNIYSLPRLQAWMFLQVAYGLSFLGYRSYEGAFRHTGVRDLSRLLMATITAVSGAYFISRFSSIWIQYNFAHLSIAFLILHGFSFIMGVLGLRLFVKLAYSRFYLKTADNNKPGLVIYGAGITGVSVRRAVQQDPNFSSQLVAFVDDNPNLIGKRIDGIKVYSFEDVFEDKFLSKYRVTSLIWSIQNVNTPNFLKVGDVCIDKGISFQRVPNINEIIGGTITSKQLKKVKIEDLLNRNPISLDKENIETFIQGKSVLITGAAGSIGSEIVRQVIHYKPSSLTLVDSAETPVNELVLELNKIISKSDIEFEKSQLKVFMGDVTRENRIDEIFAQTRPEVVFHAAAYKHVPLMEDNAKEAVRVNVVGTQIVANCSIKFNTKKFVMISTDKAVNPTNVMGASKRTAEILVQELNEKSDTEFIITRFGNVLGSNGSVIPLFRKQIENREDITVTHKDIVRYFMTIPEAVQLVLEAGVMGNGGEIFVFDMGEPVRIYELAEKMVRLSGLELGKDIRIIESGLRPGEKLYEELLSDTENTIPTHHPKIMIAKVRTYNQEETKPVFEKLSYSALNGATDLELVRLMKVLVPEFKSKNSIFEGLDKS